MKVNKLIAVTGKICSGKSLSIDYIGLLGYKILKSDDLNKELLNDKKYKEELKKHFPNVFKNNVLDKNLFRKEIFSSQENIDLIDSLSHKKIIKKIKLEKEKEDLLFVEITAPTKYSLSIFDEIIIIQIDKDLEIKRLKERKNFSESEINEILISQEEGLKYAFEKKHYIIENNSDVLSLKRNIKKVIDKIEYE